MRLPCLLFVTLFASLVSIAPAEDLKKIAEANERAFANALKTKNKAWFKGVTAPDFYETNATGAKVNRAQAISQMDTMFGLDTVTAISLKVLKVTPKGRGMTVFVDAHIVVSGLLPQGSKLSTIDTTSRYEETWSKDRGKWLMHVLKTTSSTTKIDGKKIKNG